ncbi:MAG: hypothetical protein ACRC7G_12160 [Beijerinckiaceae bacterium]
MFDCIILARTPEATARTLACLVEGVVAGTILRATLVAEQPSPAFSQISDAAGCDLAISIAGRSAHATTPHVLLFADGAMPQPGWPERLLAEMSRRGAPVADAAWWLRPESSLDLLKLQLALALRRSASPRNGVLAPRTRLTEIAQSHRVRARGSDRMIGITSARLTP